MTSPTVTDAERLAALAALAIGSDPTGAASTPAPVVRTGRTLYAGGDVPRLLILQASLTYCDTPGLLEHAPGQIGDVVLLTQAQAERLDSLDATAPVDATPAEVVEQQATASTTDEQLAAMTAAQLVAHVTQHPTDRDRVRTIEEARPVTSRNGSGPRRTVLAATEPTPQEDDEAERVGAERDDALRLKLEDAARHDADALLDPADPDPVTSRPAPVLPAQTIGALAPPTITPPED